MEKHNTTPLHRTTAPNQSIFTKIVRFFHRSCHAKNLGFFVYFVPNRPLPLTPARARNRQYVRGPMANHCAAHSIPLPPKPLDARAIIVHFFGVDHQQQLPSLITEKPVIFFNSPGIRPARMHPQPRAPIPNGCHK
jgi:hypothetical protein